MAADQQPSNADLAWRIDKLGDRLDDVVGRREYDAAKSGTDLRLADAERGLAETRREFAAAVDQVRRDFTARIDTERAARENGDRQVNDRITTGEQAGSASRSKWHDRLWTGALPALVAAIGVLAEILINHGGH